MSAKLNIMRDSIGNIIIQMSGYLEYQNSKHLKDSIEDVYISYPEVEIKIDMAGIMFVGSSGICHFVDTIKGIKQFTKKKVKLSNVDIDFKKIFMLYNLTHAEVEISTFSLNYERDAEIDKSVA